MQPDLIAPGEPMIEFNQLSDGGAGNWRMGHGGDTSNSAIAAARQGAKVGYLTALGADDFGDALMRLWQAEGVDASRILRNPAAHTGVYFVAHGPNGHSFSYLRAGSAASRMQPEDLPADYIAGARILHVSGISQAISASACDTVFAAIQIARRAGVQVSYDTNLRLKLWPLARARAISAATVPQCDTLLPSLEDAEALTGLSDPNAIIDHYLTAGAQLVVLKMGKAGAILATPDNRDPVPGRVVQAVDATGAGDTFDGAFLARLLAGDAPLEAARFANAAAALSTTGVGAVAPMPTEAAVRDFLRAS